METIFKNLAGLKEMPLTGESSQEVGLNLHVNGRTKVSRGIYTEDICWWGEIHSSYIDGYFDIEISDGDTEGYYVDGLKLDSRQKFIDSLNNAGLSSVASLMKIEWEDAKQIFKKEVLESSEVKKFTKGKKYYGDLSEKDKKRLVILQAIEKSIPSWITKRYELQDEDGNLLPVEELQQILKSL